MGDLQQSEFPAGVRDLEAAVGHLARFMQGLSDVDLSQPYRWGAHQEGVRFALLGAHHELRALAVRLAAERRRHGPPLTRAHHALAQYNQAFRDLDAVLLGVTAEEYEEPPAPGEWPLRYVVGHMVGAERNFFTLVHYGLRRQREGGDLPAELPEGETGRVLGPFEAFRDIMENRSLEAMRAFHAGLRARALAEFADMTDEEIDGPSVWWEGKPYTLEYRLHRFDAHLRQHTVQIEKTLAQIGRAPNEARRLLRPVYNALAEVEAACIGAPELEPEAGQELAASIAGRVEAVGDVLQRVAELETAVTGGDLERVRALLAADADLAGAVDAQGTPLVRKAAYYGQRAAADALIEAGAELDIYDGAALGRLDVVEEQYNGWGDFVLKDASRDGYTALQLACFFGHEEIARLLIEKGSDVEAVSQNAQRIRPIHAAAAGRALGIVEALLEAGADPNAVQQDSFRPLHAAAQHNDAAMARLLLDHGADPNLTDDRGRAPRDLATEPDVVALLS